MIWIAPLLVSNSLRHIDLTDDLHRQIVVDREAGQYLGHPTMVLLKDGRTVLAVYPKGHGRGPIILKRSTDQGLTWGPREPTPSSWETSLETPTIHRVIDPQTAQERLILWSGLNPARLATGNQDGSLWSELNPVGTWGGIVVMSSVERLSDGDYMAFFHDDGRFFYPEPQSTGVFTVYQSRSRDGGVTWSFPETMVSRADMHLCEPGVFRSPDGKSLAMLLRENSRKFNSQVMFSHDEGRTWTLPRALPRTLTGDRHVAKVAPDGRIVVSYRDMPPQGEWKGDWVMWVGTWDDLLNGRPGQYKVRLKDNKNDWDCGYPAIELFEDGTLLLTSYGHWTESESPYILAVRLKLSELEGP